MRQETEIVGKGTPVSRSTTASPSDKRRKKSIDPGPELAHAATTKSVVDTSTTKRGCGFRVLKHHRTATRSSYVSYVYNYNIYIYLFNYLFIYVVFTKSDVDQIQPNSVQLSLSLVRDAMDSPGSRCEVGCWYDHWSHVSWCTMLWKIYCKPSAVKNARPQKRLIKIRPKYTFHKMYVANILIPKHFLQYNLTRLLYIHPR